MSTSRYSLYQCYSFYCGISSYNILISKIKAVAFDISASKNRSYNFGTLWVSGYQLISLCSRSIMKASLCTCFYSIIND